MTPERCKELLPVMQAFAEGKQIKRRRLDDTVWEDVVDECSWYDLYEYRIKPEKKRVPLTRDDLPPVCWLQGKSDGPYLMLSFTEDGVRIGSSFSISFEDAMRYNWEYSSDLRNWKPCWKEVEQ